jgi:hypothetical protein
MNTEKLRRYACTTHAGGDAKIEGYVCTDKECFDVSHKHFNEGTENEFTKTDVYVGDVFAKPVLFAFTKKCTSATDKGNCFFAWSRGRYRVMKVVEYKPFVSDRVLFL